MSHELIDRAGLLRLTRGECLERLSGVRTGRIGFHAAALPVVLPVAFALDGESVVIRVRAGSQLDSATQNAVVAFEADDVDRANARRWSVAATGRATQITSAAELDRARAMDLEDWGGDENDRFVRISLDVMSGRDGSVAPHRNGNTKQRGRRRVP